MFSFESFMHTKMYSNNHYNNALLQLARNLRNGSNSKAEKILWKKVLSRKQIGVRVLGQRPIDKYIVDFFIPTFKLIIEIDGTSHEFKGEEDMIRQANLEALGFRIIRFREQEVLDGIDATRDKIQFALSCLK
jgi:very-short-patch-repair endonuclease